VPSSLSKSMAALFPGRTTTTASTLRLSSSSSNLRNTRWSLRRTLDLARPTSRDCPRQPPNKRTLFTNASLPSSSTSHSRPCSSSTPLLPTRGWTTAPAASTLTTRTRSPAMPRRQRHLSSTRATSRAEAAATCRTRKTRRRAGSTTPRKRRSQRRPRLSSARRR